MLNVADFCFELQKNDIGFFCGVPDSLLKSFCAFISDNYPEDKNVITANEGNAIALASGYYLATGKIGCVYMQNSGLGNCVNPLLSLADKDVYGIPMLLIIGWRGEPNVKDEPQHIKQGQVTLSLLDAMEIEYRVLENMSDISTLVPLIKQNNKPYALVIRKGTFENCLQLQKDLVTEYKKDVAKYHEKLDQIRILNTFESIPIFLSKENKKFMPSQIRKKGTLDEYMPCIQWLKDAGLALLCHNLKSPQIPLQGNYDEEKFKIYFFDTGLLLSMLDPESQQDFRVNRNFGIYKGGLYENIIAGA